MTDTPNTPSTGTGLAPNVAGALSYLLGPLTGILFLVIEKDSRFVRFHAAQSTVTWVGFIVVSIALSIVTTVLGFIPVFGWIVAILGIFIWLALGLGGFGLWLFLMFQAFQGNEWEVPVAGGYARRLLAGTQLAPPR